MSLKKTVKTVASLRIPRDLKPELVIIDNGSEDGTSEWLRRLTVPNMQFRFVEQHHRGQARARNAGLNATSADIILFTDDDVRLPANWLEAMCAPILSGSADAVRGKSVLANSRRRPWMQGFHRAVLAETEGIDEGGRTDIVGLSMAFSRHVLERVPAFDPELGPGTKYGFFDDTLFSYQLKEAGFRIVSVVDAPVEHVPGRERLTRKGYVRAAETRGRGLSYLNYHWHHEEEQFWTNKSSSWQFWRSPRIVLLKRLFNLWSWRTRNVFRRRTAEGIEYREFALVNQLFQIRQYLEYRCRPRNYDRKGLIKRRGVR